jgi:hypothetical protein
MKAVEVAVRVAAEIPRWRPRCVHFISSRKPKRLNRPKFMSSAWSYCRCRFSSAAENACALRSRTGSQRLQKPHDTLVWTEGRHRHLPPQLRLSLASASPRAQAQLKRRRAKEKSKAGKGILTALSFHCGGAASEIQRAKQIHVSDPSLKRPLPQVRQE